jgi:hypothetical protein
MPQEAIAPLPSGHYWTRPHTPFPLDGPNRHDEVFPGAHYVSNGNGVTFYKNWACMLTAQEDTQPFSPNQTYHPGNQQQIARFGRYVQIWLRSMHALWAIQAESIMAHRPPL